MVKINGHTKNNTGKYLHSNTPIFLYLTCPPSPHQSGRTPGGSVRPGIACDSAKMRARKEWY
ncbi:hypothetical protein E2C01_007250 [Portunus trituberculatus]|uniref:Uncharacterized protein n=1 Tax=Portunus trituberculatus TaxID=210409 RepID=A0A5B7D3V3_PORTR|nr:hypothetical protein [Portunus trituberculatus]